MFQRRIKQNDYIVTKDNIEGVVQRPFNDDKNVVILDYQYNEHKVCLKNCKVVNKFKKSMRGEAESRYSKIIINELLKKFKLECFTDILCDYEEIKNQINCLHNEIANGGVTKISFQWVLMNVERGFTYLRANESLDDLISYSGGLDSIDGRAEIKVVYDESIEIIFNGGEFKNVRDIQIS